MDGMADNTASPERIRRVLATAGLVGLGLLFYSTIHPFVAALAWSVILALSLWPMFRWVRKRLPGPAAAAPLLMVAFITLGLLIPLVLTGLLVVGEAQDLVENVRGHVMGERGDLAATLAQVPFAGEGLRDGLESLRARPELFQKSLNENREVLLGIATKVMGDLLQNTFKIVICIFSAYFLFRYGESLAEQTRLALSRLGGARLEALLPRVRETVRAVVYGLLMTALAQAGLAALGFWVAGVSYPLLLALLIFIVSFIPFGPPFIWVPAAVSVMMNGRMMAGILLFIWGAGVISGVDNVLRPIFIGQATRMPVLLVFIAVLGGVVSFGMVGLFVGPVIMAVTLSLWRDWIARQEDVRTDPPVWAAGAPAGAP